MFVCYLSIHPAHQRAWCGWVILKKIDLLFINTELRFNLWPLFRFSFSITNIEWIVKHRTILPSQWGGVFFALMITIQASITLSKTPYWVIYDHLHKGLFTLHYASVKFTTTNLLMGKVRLTMTWHLMMCPKNFFYFKSKIWIMSSIITLLNQIQYSICCQQFQLMLIQQLLHSGGLFIALVRDIELDGK